MDDKAITKEVLRDIVRNYRAPLALAAVLETLMIIYQQIDPMEPWQFWMMTIICTAVYPACIVYGIIKYRRMKKGGKE